MAIGLVASSEASEQQKKGSQSTQLDMTLWQTIEVPVQQIPFTKTKVESVLSVGLDDKDTSNVAIKNTAFAFFVGGPIKLSDDVVIGNVDLRIRHKEGHPGFLVLNLAGSCIGLDAVRAHYGDLKITDFPRGRSLDEVTSHTTALEWGELSFSFKERNPDCLSSIAFAPRESEASDAVK
ncbi:hypothetical protein AAHK20_07220 [Trinickia sp. YCB016]